MKIAFSLQHVSLIASSLFIAAQAGVLDMSINELVPKQVRSCGCAAIQCQPPCLQQVNTGLYAEIEEPELESLYAELGEESPESSDGSDYEYYYTYISA